MQTKPFTKEQIMYNANSYYESKVTKIIEQQVERWLSKADKWKENQYFMHTES